MKPELKMVPIYKLLLGSGFRSGLNYSEYG